MTGGLAYPSGICRVSWKLSIVEIFEVGQGMPCSYGNIRSDDSDMLEKGNCSFSVLSSRKMIPQGGEMIILKILGKFIKTLRSDASPNQIAWGFALGAIPGLTPVGSPHNVLILFLVLLLRVNISSALLGFILYSCFAWVLDPLFHTIGFAVLVRLHGLESVWTWLYNTPAALFQFNNTVVMGSLLSTLVLIVPNYFVFKWVVCQYRDTWNARIQKWRITQILQGNRLVQFYIKVRNIGG